MPLADCILRIQFLSGRPLDHTLAATRFTTSLVPISLRHKLLSKLGEHGETTQLCRRGGAFQHRSQRRARAGLLTRTVLARCAVITRHQGDLRKWGLHPNVPVTAMHPTVSQELLPRIGTGLVRVKPTIKSFTDSGVTFADGTHADVDVVIFATGYHITFPYLAPSLLSVTGDNRTRLFLHMLQPALPPTLAVVGLIQPLGESWRRTRAVPRPHSPRRARLQVQSCPSPRCRRAGW